MQRHLRFLRRQRQREREQREQERTQWNPDSSLGSMHNVPNDLLQQLLVGLGAYVRGASRALRAAFDARNTTLLLRGADDEFDGAVPSDTAPDDVAWQVVNVVRHTPQLSDLTVRMSDPAQLRAVLQALPAALPLPCLRRLNVFPFMPPLPAIDLFALASLLAGMPSLTDLTLGNFQLHPNRLNPSTGAAELGQSLTQLTALQSLSLRSLHLLAGGLALCAPGIRALTSLRSLDLTYSSMDTEAAAVLSGCLEALAPSAALTSLCLASVSIGAMGARALCPGLRTLTCLHTLDLSNTDMGEQGIQHLAPALNALTGLLDLNMQSTGAAATALPPTLASLTRLDLSSSNMGAAGAAQLAPALGAMTALLYLDISLGDLRPAGARALAPTLAQLPSLTSLHLHSNRLETEGADALRPALVTLTALQILDLSHNQLVAADIQALAAAVNQMGALRKLGLHNSFHAPPMATPAVLAQNGLLLPPECEVRL